MHFKNIFIYRNRMRICGDHVLSLLSHHTNSSEQKTSLGYCGSDLRKISVIVCLIKLVPEYFARTKHIGYDCLDYIELLHVNTHAPLINHNF